MSAQLKVGLRGPKRVRTETKVVFLGILGAPAVALRQKPAAAKIWKPNACLSGPVPLERGASPHVEGGVRAEETPRAIACPVRETASGRDAPKLRVDAIASDERDAAGLDGFQRALEEIRFVRCDRLLLFLPLLLLRFLARLLREGNRSERKHRE